MKKIFKRHLLVQAALSIFVAIAVLTLVGCEGDEGPMETAGGKIDNAVESTGHAVTGAAETTGHAIKGAGEKTGDAVENTVK